jgi:hypothetical protein
MTMKIATMCMAPSRIRRGRACRAIAMLKAFHELRSQRAEGTSPGTAHVQRSDNNHQHALQHAENILICDALGMARAANPDGRLSHPSAPPPAYRTVQTRDGSSLRSFFPTTTQRAPQLLAPCIWGKLLSNSHAKTLDRILTAATLSLHPPLLDHPPWPPLAHLAAPTPPQTGLGPPATAAPQRRTRYSWRKLSFCTA